jgi:hypothetical protein
MIKTIEICALELGTLKLNRIKGDEEITLKCLELNPMKGMQEEVIYETCLTTEQAMELIEALTEMVNFEANNEANF